MLPGGEGDAHTNPPMERTITAASTPARQLSEVPKDELENLAEEFGLDPRDFKTRQNLVAAIHGRRQMIATLDREAMMDVIRWGRRPVVENSGKEHLAQEIVRIKSMRFAGLSQQGLIVLAKLRGVKVDGRDDVPAIVKRLKKQEGFFRRMNRKRRAMLGSIVSNMLGESGGDAEYRFVPEDEAAPSGSPGPTTATATRPAMGPMNAGSAQQPSIKDEIEESGLFGGLASRIKRSADDYLNQKLDEIESRIDRKLDEIDRRLGEWRDKEIANRLRILKITLWASVIVGAFSLIYSYVKEAVSPSRPQVQDIRGSGTRQ